MMKVVIFNTFFCIIVKSMKYTIFSAMFSPANTDKPTAY